MMVAAMAQGTSKGVIGAFPQLAPRGLSREQSAAYIGFGTTKFDEMVRDGRMPPPKRVDARIVWDRLALDLAFEALGEEQQEDDRAKAKRAWDEAED